MLQFSSVKQRALGIFLLASYFILGYVPSAKAQTLSIKDFAVWGGSAPANVFDNKQGVFIKQGCIISGNIGSNHQVVIKDKFLLKGDIFSGNGISFTENVLINGNLFALKTSPGYSNPVISSKEKSLFNGDLTANGKINIKSEGLLKLSYVKGKVAVPAPTATNYTGPTPKGGFTNTIALPVLPVMPNITPFDTKAGTAKLSNNQTIVPGSFGKMELPGNKTLTFNGPGNYIFTEINNTSANNLVFDLKNKPEGTINIFVVGNAKFSAISVKIINGTSASQIYTEVHGDGLTNGGNAFEIVASGSYRSGTSAWFGNVWAPRGGIRISGCKTSLLPHVLGALWSAKQVSLEENFVLTYQAPANSTITYVEPYYPPPANGKVTTTNNIIGAELTSLATNPAPITNITKNEIFVINHTNEKVMIEVISKVPNDVTLKNQLIALGMTDFVDNGPHQYVITGSFPINKLTQLNSNVRIEYVRPLYPPINNQGQVTTQGDVTMKSDKVRERFGLDGSGVKIGILSDSYNNKSAAQDDVDQGDLPGVKSTGDSNQNAVPVQVTSDLASGGNDEGRAMLQIVHDLAPMAKLAFRTGFRSAGDFARGIRELASPTLAGGKCDIIVDDLSYITEPFLRDGIVAKTVDSVVADGVTYFTSAGNFGKRSYEGVFNGVTNASIIPSPAQIHRFGSTNQDIYQTVKLMPGTYTIVLQWDDQFHSLGDPGVQTDLDLYIVGATGFTLFGFNRSNLFKDPFEVCPFTVNEETNAKIMVVRAGGSNNVRFKYIIFRGDATMMDYQTGNSTIVGHANANGAISVGAMLYDNIQPYTPVWPGVASFSSRGGTFTLQNGSFITRNKPDLVAPNGVNTTVRLGESTFSDGDTYPNFFGTSAAAPHAAGVGALLIQGRKKFNLQTTVTPAEIKQQLISSTGKFPNLPAAFNFEGGNGYILADSAMAQIANPTPKIDTIESVIAGGETGNTPFMVKVKGEYLRNNTQIYVGGTPVATTVSPNRKEATAMVNALHGTNPAFRLYTPAKSVSGDDGGLSNPYYFFEGNIQEVVVKAINKTRKYGQPNPGFDVEITIDGIPIEETDISISDLQLDIDDLALTTIASASSRAGNYGIFVDRATPLPPGHILLSTYNFIFESGTLVIEKMPLKITPLNMQITYGEFPEQIEYSYDLPEEFTGNATLLDEIKAIHQQYIPGNGLVVLNGIMGAGHNVEFADFENVGVLASYQSVMNSRKLSYQNGILKPLVGELPIGELGEQRFMVDVNVYSMAQYKQDSSVAAMLPGYRETMPKGLLNLKALTKGEAEASVPNGQLKAMVNGQLQAMVNGQLKAMVNGQLRALVNGEYVDADDFTFLNGQLRALVNGEWLNITNGQLRAVVNYEEAYFDLFVSNGQLQAVVNGQLMPVVNGQLQAVVNGQLVAVVNGQLKALVNGQLMPMVNGQLVAMINGQLQPMVNGQLVAVVNGQLMAVVNGELEIIEELSFVNGQLRALVNGQLRALVNGQLKAMVNGEVTDIPTEGLTLVNGQLRAVVNGQLIAMVNGQLKAVVNGQLKAMVNGDAIAVERVEQLANGQLRAHVNGQLIPIVNGQLKAMVNGQLMAMVNGQLMAVVNGEFTFVIFQNGQLRALVNGQLQPMVNGQLKAMVNGQLDDVTDYSIANGQLRAVVNSEEWIYPNGQLKALVNGQLKALVNNFDVSGANNNARTMVVVDENDILLQGGDIGSMFAVPMITGNTAVYDGQQKIIPAAFISENFEVTYGMGDIEIMKAPVVVKAHDTSRSYGAENPVFQRDYSGLAFDDSAYIDFYPPDAVTRADQYSSVGPYSIELEGPGTQDNNYTQLKENGTLKINKALLTVRADDKAIFEGDPIPELTISYTGLVNGDTKDTVCSPIPLPTTPTVFTDLERTSTYTNIQINGQSNIYHANPGEELILTGNRFTEFSNPTTPYCPGCITQIYLGMGNGAGGNTWTDCSDVSGISTWEYDINRPFTAPTGPGVYYITQRVSWYYECYQADQGAIIHDNPEYIIAVVIVGELPASEITAGTTANSESLAGNYPIALQACNYLNPNYEVVLVNGNIKLAPVCTEDEHLWTGDGNFEDQIGSAHGSANGGVTATGEAKTGSNSFSFDGSGFIPTGTEGSVSGTGDFAVSAWVKTTGTGPMVIIQQRDGSIDGEYILKIGGKHNDMDYVEEYTGRAYFLVYDEINNPEVIDLFSTTLVNDGAWHLIRGERIGTTMNLYVDGVLEATANTPGIVHLGGSITTYIGSDQRDYGSYFNGLIDDVRVNICSASSAIISSATPPSTNMASAAKESMPMMLAMASTLTVPVVEEKNMPDGVYPNPATNTIRVHLNDKVVNINGIQVVDYIGKVNKTITRKIDNNTYETNISNLPKGVYFLKALTESGIKTFKFVKL